MNNNFNIRQFLNNFSNFNTQAQKALNAIKNENIGNLTQNAIQNQAKNVQNLQIMNMTDIPKLELALLDDLSKSKMIKDLFNLPKDFSKMLELFSNISSLKTKTLNEDIKLDIGKIIAFLQENGKEAEKKLHNLMVALNKSGYTQTEQLNELKYIINACIPTPQSNSATVMKNLILLYLPWLPLGEELGFDIDIKTGEDDEKGNNEDDCVTILIQTINYGNVKIFLMAEGKTNILIKITCVKHFPKTKVEKIFKTNIADYNINHNISFDTTEQNIEKKNFETKVNINTSNHINPFLLLATQTIIKIVIEFDKNYTLEETRKKLLDRE